jgi:nuclear RNA export factor
MVARAARGAKNAPRGPAATRRDRTKADRDGDLAMDGPVKGRGGRVGKSSGGPAKNARKDLTAGKGKGGILSAANQRAILKHAGTGDVAMKGSKSVPSRGLTELKVTNWKKSKASTNPDGGVSSLITWLEKKASNRLGSRVRSVKIKKVCRRHYSYCYSGSCYTPRQPIYSGPLSFANHLATTVAIPTYGRRQCGD